MNRFEKEEDNKSLMSKSLISTVKSIDRTFLAQVRTAAIFSGLSILLLKKNQIFKTKMVLIFSIILLLILCFTYYNNIQMLLKSDENKKHYFYDEYYFNISFAILLIFIQIILLF